MATPRTADQIRTSWLEDPRWQGITRSYGVEDVVTNFGDGPVRSSAAGSEVGVTEEDFDPFDDVEGIVGRAADVMLLNKCDLLPYLEFNVEQAEANARRVNPDLIIFRVSATSGEGLAAWVAWIEKGLEAQRGKRSESVDALRRRVAELERQLENARAAK